MKAIKCDRCSKYQSGENDEPSKYSLWCKVLYKVECYFYTSSFDLCIECQNELNELVARFMDRNENNI